MLDLPASVDDLPACVPGHTLHNLAYYRRRAGREGTLRFEQADRTNLNQACEALLRLHSARWHGRGESGVLATASVQSAHREALPQLLDAGLLRIYLLRLDEQIIAALYGLCDA